DQVQRIGLAVARRVGQSHGLRLDGYAAFLLDLHGIEHLLAPRHLPRVQPPGELDQPVGERRLAVVDMRDDREVPDIVDGGGRHGAQITLARRSGKRSGKRHGYVAPPSTVSAWPVRKEAASEARKRAVPMRSSGPSGRGMHWSAMIRSFCSGVTVLRSISVKVAPGRMALTVMPWGPSSRASERVMPSSA